MGEIVLKTEIPGPRGRAVLERRAAAVSSGLARATDVVVARARGALVEDVDGNTLIDLAGGIGMLALGHCPPAVVEAVQQQAAELVHVCSIVATTEPMVRLCEVLAELTPGDFAKKTLLANSGSEAVENAVNVARTFTKRSAVIAFEGAYHGRTMLALSLTSKYGLFKKGLGPFAPEVYRLPAPYPYRAPAGMSADDYLQSCEDALERGLVAQVDPSAVAAIVIEPVQGEAGFIPMPARFLRKIREVCDRHGIVMIADEVQSGFCRTGELFAIQHSGVIPDVVVMAKALGSGMPISAVTGRAEILDSVHVGGVGGTYGGSPVACAAALAAIEAMRAPGFLEGAREIGRRLEKRLDEWRERFPLVGDARGAGAMRLVELVLDRGTRQPAPDQTLAVIRRATARGVLLIRAGLYSNCIRFLPPLVITGSQLDEGLSVVEEALDHVQQGLQG